MLPEKPAPSVADSGEKGSLGILHVKRLWSRTLAKRLNQVQEAVPPEDWLKDNTLVCGLGLGLRETLQYLYDTQPSFDRFQQWILEMNGGMIEPKRIDPLNQALSGERKTGASARSGKPRIHFWRDDILGRKRLPLAPRCGCSGELPQCRKNDLRVFANGPESA